MPRPRSKKPEARKPPTGTPPRHWLFWLGAILFVTFIVYQPSLDNAFTNWDDNYYVTENPVVMRPSFLGILTYNLGGNYHPLTIASLALDYAIAGPRPALYHWINLFLHLLNTALVFWFVRKLSGGRFWTTVVTALFFGIHPMHVESVAWVAGRKDVLYALFYFVALIAYLAYLDKKNVVWLAVTWLSFVLSVASKPAAVVLPIALLAIDYFRRRPLRPGVLVEKVAFLVIAVGAGVLTFVAQKSVGAVAAPHQWTLVQRLLFASYGTVMYVVKLFLPFRLSAIYPYPTEENPKLGPEFYIAFVALVILLPTIIYLFRRSRPVLFGIAFFFINVVLVLQFLSVGQAVMADRYTYLPYVGLFFALAWWLDERPGPRLFGVPMRVNLGALFVALAVVSLLQTWIRCDVWQNAGTLWNDTIAKYPGRIVDAYNNRGYYYIETGHYDRAIRDFDQAIALNAKVPRVWINKGNALAELGQNDSAYVAFERALQLKPDSPEALSNRGGIRVRQGDLQGAVEDYTRAIEINPNFRDAYGNRALAYFKMEDFEKAVADRRRVIAMDPKSPTNYIQLGSIGLALQQLGRHDEAIAAYGEAIRLAPPEDRQRVSGFLLRRSQARWALKDADGARRDAREARALGAVVDSAYARTIGETP